MRVLMDASPILGGRLGGVGYYCHNLALALGQMQNDVQVSFFYKRSSKKKKRTVLPDYPGVKELTTWYPYQNVWNVVGFHWPYLLPLDWLVGDYELYHGTDSRGLPRSKMKQVVTFHDLAHLRCPETVSRKDLAMHTQQMPYFCKHSDRLIAVSESTKRDLVELIGVESGKIDVIPLAASAKYRTFNDQDADVLQQVRQKYRLPEQYVLFLGSLHPRKNIPNMLAAFAQVRKKEALPHHFVLAGMNLGAKAEIEQTVAKYQLEDIVHWIGYIEEADKPALYNGAALFSFVSLFEGFGLPVLEAMQCGTPVLTSSTSSLPEVVGDMRCCADPGDIDMMSARMQELLVNQELIYEARNNGLQRAETFSWTKTAQLTLETYRKALGG